MQTYRIHISGLVQGVGFRPYVSRLAKEYHLKGWVSNSNTGVYIEFTANRESATKFYHAILAHPPGHAVISHHDMVESAYIHYSGFTIRPSDREDKPDLMLTPDLALCKDCSRELLDITNKRFHYPFTTCLQCGPRYSITTGLPYDRANTTMKPLPMCSACEEEYQDIENRRHYSQTNSCKTCGIPMHLYSPPGVRMTSDPEKIMVIIQQILKSGQILAVKGIGGYLLMGDATRESTVDTLRSRKHRPSKPFALLYPDLETASMDVEMNPCEIKAMESKAAPIVLCTLKGDPKTGICHSAIAPGLDKIGLMLPYTPLLLLISKAFGKPLIATSGNLSGSPILYRDQDALEHLFEVADYILTYDRDILVPQDDSVMHFTAQGQRILLRRSRGLAPNYFPNPFNHLNESVLAMGGELKGAFALLEDKNLYLSQYLGDQGSLESQASYTQTLDHLTQLLKAQPRHILIDKHPEYFVSRLGKQMAVEQHIPVTAIQHHKAHFGAVLAENHLLDIREPVLGVIWDGTGFGDDDQIWGGEIFVYEDQEMERMGHLRYFPHLLGDKMSREPRLSALSLLTNLSEKLHLVKPFFTEQEWQYYSSLVKQDALLQTSSMGRLMDGIAALLGLRTHNRFEGEAAMLLEAHARKCKDKPTGFYPFPLVNTRWNWQSLISGVIEDLERKMKTEDIAWKVFYSLAKGVEQVSSQSGIGQIAFSGGVFQNVLLTELLTGSFGKNHRLYFHRQTSPNDECIGLGQLACYSIMNRKPKERSLLKTNTLSHPV